MELYWNLQMLQCFYTGYIDSWILSSLYVSTLDITPMHIIKNKVYFYFDLRWLHTLINKWLRPPLWLNAICDCKKGWRGSSFVLPFQCSQQLLFKFAHAYTLTNQITQSLRQLVHECVAYHKYSSPVRLYSDHPFDHHDITIDNCKQHPYIHTMNLLLKYKIMISTCQLNLVQLMGGSDGNMLTSPSPFVQSQIAFSYQGGLSHLLIILQGLRFSQHVPLHVCRIA